MNNKIKEVVSKLEGLPEEERESFAAFVLQELESDERWSELLHKSNKALTNLANEALQEYKSGETKKLDFDKL
jgi:DNA-directed RNA polymerase specialized sigma24 family protein